MVKTLGRSLETLLSVLKRKAREGEVI